MSESRYEITSVEGNRQRLDGGAMFGNAPKALWSRWVPCDEQNRIDLACRAFLIVDRARDRRILLETGIGAFFAPKLRDRYGVRGEGHLLLENLAALGVAPEEVDDIVLSHLHFDHAGGLLTPWVAGKAPSLVFPRARIIVGDVAWARAQTPHRRDHASFIPALVELLAASGRLVTVEAGEAHPLGDDFSFSLSEGHTPGQLLTELTTDEGSVAFAGDLIPGVVWMHPAITMGYDRFPELLVEEKERFLSRAHRRDTRLLFTHDAAVACAQVAVDAKGRYIAGETWATLSTLVL